MKNKNASAKTRKLTKKEIYAKHGIIFKNNHILYNGKMICELLKKGNSKTGETVFTWSMLPGTSGTCICDCTGCYAKTGFYKTKTTKESLKFNTDIVNNDIDFFYNAISAQLEYLKSGEIRIHASGDFNTKNPDAYAQTWKKIVNENPSFLFWTYTKIKKYETLFDDVANGNIVKSIINGIGYNFGKCEYIMKTYKKLKAMDAKVWICKCGIDANQHCAGCKKCSTYQFVLFIEHSTDYKAENDPLFDELKALINSQDE